MRRRASLSGWASFGLSEFVDDALDAHVIAANAPRAAIGVDFALILATHDAALIVRRFDDIARFIPPRIIIAAIPGGRLYAVIECSEVVDRMPDAVANAVPFCALTRDSTVGLQRTTTFASERLAHVMPRQFERVTLATRGVTAEIAAPKDVVHVEWHADGVGVAVEVARRRCSRDEEIGLVLWHAV